MTPIEHINAIENADRSVQDAIDARVRVGCEAAVEELRKVVNFKPECGFPRGVARRYGNDDLADALFFCEGYLYELLGKEDARVILCQLDRLAQALGFRMGIRELQS